MLILLTQKPLWLHAQQFTEDHVYDSTKDIQTNIHFNILIFSFS